MERFRDFFAKSSEDGFLTNFVDNCHCDAGEDGSHLTEFELIKSKFNKFSGLYE